MSSIGIESRRWVLQTLADSSGKYKKDVLNEKFSQNTVPVRDRSLMMEFVHGITRRHRTLEFIYRKYCKRPSNHILIENIVLIGLFQLLFMDKVPPYAAINTSVELAKDASLTKDAGFVNAILRSVQRDVKLVEACPPATDILPLYDKAWRFKNPIFPDVRENPYEYWGVVHSYPTWLVKKWYDRFGKDKCIELLLAGNYTPPVFLRPRVSIEEVEREIYSQGISFSRYKDNFIKLEEGKHLEELSGFAQGKWVVSGIASTDVVNSIQPKPGSAILEMCAAPGGKTMYLAEIMQNQGKIVACDISEERLKLLENAKTKLGLGIIETKVLDCRSLPESFYNSFDHVLVDAPCSNSAVFAKRPEARWRFDKATLLQLQELQLALMQQGVKALKTGGFLTYSTCSLEPEENHEVVHKLIKSSPNLQIIMEKQILPLPPTCDGGTFFKILKA